MVFICLEVINNAKSHDIKLLTIFLALFLLFLHNEACLGCLMIIKNQAYTLRNYD